ncbi:hypothetical protein ACVBEF_20730 [Glaciimonas sp. GG7]
MPNTNASQTSPHAAQQTLSDAIDCEQQLFIMEHDARSANLSKAIAIIFNLIEANDAYRSPSHPSFGDASKLPMNIDDDTALKAFMLDAIKLSGEYALQQIEWLEEHQRTLRKARKAAVEDAARACSK